MRPSAIRRRRSEPQMPGPVQRPIQDFVLEVQRSRAGADLASGPAFDLRAGFDADTIRRGQVLTLYPYDNTLRAVRITGEQLRAYLEWSARYFRVDPAGRIAINDSVPGYDFDLVRGARYDIDLLQPLGQRIRNLTVRGPAGAAGGHLHPRPQQSSADGRGRLHHASRRSRRVRPQREHRRAPRRGDPEARRRGSRGDSAFPVAHRAGRRGERGTPDLRHRSGRGSRSLRGTR